MRTRRIPLLLAAFAAAFLGVAVTPGPASADLCPSGFVCIFANANFGGNSLWINADAGESIPNLHQLLCSGCAGEKHPGSRNTWGDQMSSYINNSNQPYWWYYDIDFGGRIRFIPANSAAASLGGDNDEASSIGNS